MPGVLAAVAVVWAAWAVAALAATTPTAKAPAATSKTATTKAGTKKTAASPPKASGAVATVGTSRTIDQIDIQRAAQALYTDPLRVKDPGKWRRSLLDRCVDRELLDMEAQKQGLDRDSALVALRNEREYSVFWREIYRRVLIPRLTPKLNAGRAIASIATPLCAENESYGSTTTVAC